MKETGVKVRTGLPIQRCDHGMAPGSMPPMNGADDKSQPSRSFSISGVDGREVVAVVGVAMTTKRP